MKYLLPLFLLIFVPSHALDASYDIGSDLVLLNTSEGWYSDKDIDPKDGRDPWGYHAVYWNPKTNEYYYATGDTPYNNLRITNNLSYEIDPAKQETNYTDTELEYIEYAGSISPLERLYIDKKDGTQYIKILKKITDPFPIYVSPVKINPASKYPSISYTNAEGRRFSRILHRDYEGGQLHEY